jgi:hypothetical protein
MKIELDIRPEQLEEELKKIIENMDGEQKRELAKTAITNAMEVFSTAINKDKRQELALREIQREHPDARFDMSRNRLLSVSYETQMKYERMVIGYEKISNYFLHMLIGELTEEIRDFVKKEVFKSKPVRKMVADTCQLMRDKMPEIIKEALLAKHMADLNAVTEAFSRQCHHTNSVEIEVGNLRDQLMSRGIL